MLVINPDECIDCGVCEPECPADAIVPDTNKKHDLTGWLKLNAEYSRVWPRVTKARPHDPNAAGYDGEPHKLEKYFSALPGTGD
jgi:ferredoxin